MTPHPKPRNGNPSPKPKRRFSPATIVLIGMVIFFVITLVMIYPIFFNGARRTAMIKIPKNATMEMLNDSLAKYEGQEYASHVMRLIKIRNTDLSSRYGAYRIKAGQNPMAAMRRLTSGGQSPITITINGHRSLRQLAERMGAKLDASTDSLFAAMTDSAMLRKHNLTENQAKALFLNDSYDVYWTDSPRQVVDKIGAHYDRVWDGERMHKAEELGFTPAEIMTICSIVDEETNDEDEKGAVARVYINRLHCGMKLQADPTVRYALGDFSIRRILKEHLTVDSPYNTYLYPGLPPGPIRTTSVRTLDELLDSEPTFSLYMCAREDFSGSHNFADNYEDHLQNARRYQQALNERGIR